MDSIFTTYSTSEVSIEKKIEPVRIPAKKAVSLGLIVNELATNSTKHGFRGGGEDTFFISLKKDTTGQVCRLNVGNNGEAFPAEVDLQHPETLGMQLISSLIKQLSGEMELIRQPRSEFRITFPL
ncbi:MAG TPA: sensor histidine kinase [Sediminispirochaeta sp.]|nr:sensor histidine kinase [Sediminispirochaeta sp.]